MITIQFSTTKHAASKAIEFFTWSWASHVDFVLPDGRLFGALATAKGEHKAGVQFHNLSQEYSRVERYVVDAPDEVLKYALEQEGKPYDWQGIFGIVSRNRDWQEDDCWFCSELVAYSFAKAGVPLLNETSNRITPRDLLISPLLKRIS